MMHLCVFLLSLASHSVVTIDKSARGTISLQAHDTVDITVGASPITFVIPQVAGLTADVYQQGSDTNIIVGTINAKSTSFGAYFPSKGRIVVTATSATDFGYFAFESARQCSRVVVSTAASDFFSANKSGRDANLTIQNNQKVCILHVSDAPTKVSVNYSTEEDYDILYFRGDGGSEKALTGDGHYEHVSKTMSQFVWSSDATMLSNSFEIGFESESTLPARHTNFSTQSWSATATPVLLLDYSWKPSMSSKLGYDDAKVNWYARSDNEIVVNLIVLSIVGLFMVLVLVLVITFCCKWRRQKQLLDGSLVGILREADIAGVKDGNDTEAPNGSFCYSEPPMEPEPIAVPDTEDTVIE